LGVILFELLYSLTTGMERSICLGQLQQSTFPKDWDDLVGRGFPTLQPLIQSMVSVNPDDRPSVANVVSHVEEILSEYTFTSIDESKHQGPGMILLRIEAQQAADVLNQTILAIHKAAAPNDVSVVQYGLRSSTDGTAAIMEFALHYSGDAAELAAVLQTRPDIYKARHV
jgi:serine/threonine protein kinase